MNNLPLANAHAGQRFGIEEEYFLTDLRSRRMVAKPTARVLDACREAIGEGFAYELLQGQIEVASPIFDCADQAAAYLSRVRRDLNQTLAEHGLGVISSGSHPLAEWRAQRITVQSHYQQLLGEYEIVARRSVLCGLHVHAEIPAGKDRIAVMNEILPWFPMLLALSVSSPFWQGQLTGYFSYRQVACDEWPRMGIPEYLPDDQAFEHYLAILNQTRAAGRDVDVWWGCRPSQHYPTLELRITDACPRWIDALMLARLYRVMVKHACLLPAPGSHYRPEHHWMLKENRIQARRWGPYGRFVLLPDTTPMSLEQWLDRAEHTFAATARALGEEGVFTQARHILRVGTSAERQVRCFDSSHASALARRQAVVDLLLEESSAG